MKGFYFESESSTFSLLFLFMDFISVSGVAKIGGWLKAADTDVELTTMNNSTGKDRHC